MRSIIDIEEVVRVKFKIEPMLGNTKAFQEQIDAAFEKIDWIGEHIYVELEEIEFEKCVIGVTYKFEGAYNYARITEVEAFIEEQIEIFKTTIFA